MIRLTNVSLIISPHNINQSVILGALLNDASTQCL